MSNSPSLLFEHAPAICYSGYREGQQPGGPYPSYEQIKEDLLMLHGHWKYLRLYDCDPHSERVLQVIHQEQLDFKMMLGAYIVAEANNPSCPWGGGVYPEEVLQTNRIQNERQVQRLIEQALQYPDIISSLSVGNEACVEWTDHLVPVERVIHFAQMVQAQAPQPVTFCENYVPWLGALQPLGKVLDFLSIHTYPVWEYKSIDEALAYTKDNYYTVAQTYPNKPIVITEAGWTTNSNGHGIPSEHANEHFQKIYYDQLMEWTNAEGILTFIFEAFDEPWKGSPDPLEPEKHWGLYKVDRRAKAAVQ
ncbi:MAG: glycosyl hydrolase family 17 protein [Bacteroidota bacterium]